MDKGSVTGVEERRRRLMRMNRGRFWGSLVVAGVEKEALVVVLSFPDLSLVESGIQVSCLNILVSC